MALEETLYRLLFDALQAHPVVIIDDIHLLDLFSAGCHFYPRSGYFNSIMMALCTYTAEIGHLLDCFAAWLVRNCRIRGGVEGPQCEWARA